MKKIFYYLILALLLVSCGPRIEMDMAQWGDHAYIDNIQIINLEVKDDFKLAEWYQNETPIAATGARYIIINQGHAQIDSASFTATVKVKPDADLKYAGIRIFHKGTKVTPIEGSPKAGIVADLSKKELFYRIESADGSKHDWKIVLE